MFFTREPSEILIMVAKLQANELHIPHISSHTFLGPVSLSGTQESTSLNKLLEMPMPLVGGPHLAKQGTTLATWLFPGTWSTPVIWK